MSAEWEAEGLLDGVEGDAARRARLDLLDELHEQGFDADELRRAAREHRLAVLPLERALAGEGERYTLTQVAERADLELADVERYRQAFGLPIPGPDERLFTELDVRGVATTHAFTGAGVDPERQLDLARVIGRNLAQVAEAIREAIARDFTRVGDTERDVATRYAEMARLATPALGPLVEQILSDHLRTQVRRDVIYTSQLAEGNVAGAVPLAACFADLVGFTRFGESSETEAVGLVARRLGELAGEVACQPVRLVKLLGDAVMLVSREPEPLLDAALDLVGAVEAEEDFPELRVGAAFGEAIGHGGDWYGRPVNLASRLTGVAKPGSVLVSEELKGAVDEDSYAWSFAGKRHLKGINGEVAGYRVRRVTGDR